jgi:hypothetical protein
MAPIKVIGNSPATLPITVDYKFVVGGDVKVVGEFVGAGVQQQKDPQCDMKINVQGRPLPLSDVQAQLHMVKGEPLSLLRAAFCTQAKALKNSPTTQHCTAQQRQLDDLDRAFKCGDDKDLYQTMLQAGKQNYRQDLRNIFRNPEKIGQEFRTQKEIDKAWDYLQKGESYSFKEWLHNVRKS